VMLGAFGEVLVLDWGMARVDGRAEQAPTLQVRSEGEELTAAGAIPGTPSYMSPEQISGASDELRPTADVYALGAMLHELLCGRPPYSGGDAREILRRSRRGPPLRPRQVSNGAPAPLERAEEIGPLGPPVPAELEEICARAMARDPADRFRDADILGRELAAWLDGERRQEQAGALVTVARQQQDEATEKREEAARLRAEATALLSSVRPHDPVSDKRAGWAQEDRAEALERQAELRQLEYIQTLRAALLQAPDLDAPRDLLADHYATMHREAEQARDQRRADAAAVLLRSYDRGRYCDYLAGRGTLSLTTDPPARARLYRYSRWERRLVPTFLRELGESPIAGLSLPAGSYLLELHAQKRAVVRCPVRIDRQSDWSHTPPGADAPQPVCLPLDSELSEDECCVPAGWFWSGGDPQANEPLPGRRVWLDGFVVRRFPVTNAEYLGFLNDLVDQGRSDFALEVAPRERTGTQGTAGELIYGRSARGRFILVPDSDGDQWQPRWPVLKVDWRGAQAYAAWLAGRTGQPWRLPGELEWEKAARGVDGRFFPWGDTLDPTFCCMQLSHSPDRRLPADITDYPVDTSPYGVRGMAGNARDWCADPWRPAGPSIGDDGRVLAAAPVADAERRVCRGGAWWQRAPFTRAASRLGVRHFLRDVGISFRLVRSLELSPGARAASSPSGGR
ncbi:MAG: sulfatase activating formylglycine-generating enzyme, partial [Myxococcota bacterium]